MKIKYKPLLVAIGLLCFENARAQRLLKPEDLGNWPAARGAVISPDGKYAGYVISNTPAGQETLMLTTLKGDWRRSFVGGGQLSFSGTGNKAFFKVKDTLIILDLLSRKQKKIAGVNTFKITSGSSPKVIVQQKGKLLTLLDAKGEKKTEFTSITSFMLADDGTKLLLKGDKGLSQFDLLAKKRVYITDNPDVSGIIQSSSGSHVAFLVGENMAKRPVVYAEGRISEPNVTVPDGFYLDGLKAFYTNGRFLMLNIKEKPLPNPDPKAPRVDVWNWKDDMIQSVQLQEKSGQSPFASSISNFVSVYDRKKDKVIFTEDPANRIQFTQATNHVVVRTNRAATSDDRTFRPAGEVSMSLFDLYTAETIPVNFYPGINCNDRYFAGGSMRGTGIRAFDMQTKREYAISMGIPPDTLYSDNSSKNGNLHAGGYYKKQNRVVIYDPYDIWLADPTGKSTAQPLTYGAGRKNGLVFRLAVSSGLGRNVYEELRYPLLLMAMDTRSKQNGFYTITKAGAVPKKLYMGDYAFGLHLYFDFKEFFPIKAENADVYLVNRESASASPNFFWTRDFKTFHALSDVYPEKRMDWLKTDLIDFKTLQGIPSQGILYKPEHLVPGKKYPCILTYYDKLSHHKNQYRDVDDGVFNIPWFVNHGYLVFAFDMRYLPGQTGHSIVASTEGAVKALKQIDFVDAAHLGITGQSFGGYQTNYIVTHSNSFAAAFASAGFSDLVSAYFGITRGSGNFYTQWAEDGQGRLNVPFFSDKQKYLDYSPVLNADKVTTPLLLQNNVEDGIVNFSQGVEMFMALRRLNKPVWLLQYDGEGHVVGDEENATDRLLRMTQFFDHFLKNKPAPLWMTDGIPAKYKGLKQGYEPGTKN